MVAVRTLADARIRLTLLTTKPADMKAITMAELTAGIDVSCQVAKSGTRFSAAASDTLSDARFCDESNSSALGAANYEATIAPYWFLDDETGKYDAASNPAYEAVRERGTTIWCVLREGPKYTEPWAADDHYEVYEVITDNPQRPSEAGGYVKRSVPLLVQSAELHGVVAA